MKIVRSPLTIREKGEGIGVVQSRVGRETSNGVVPISMVTAERSVDTWCMSEFVENSGGLVLTVASLGDRRQIVEAWAVDNEVLRRKGVGKDAGLAFPIGIITSISGDSPAR